MQKKTPNKTNPLRHRPLRSKHDHWRNEHLLNIGMVVPDLIGQLQTKTTLKKEKVHCNV